MIEQIIKNITEESFEDIGGETEQFLKEISFIDSFKDNFDNLPDREYDFGGLWTGKGGAIKIWEAWIEELNKLK